ncbi:MAG: glycerophosphodiester phosphodiesterase [Desulfobacterales bacterium]
MEPAFHRVVDFFYHYLPQPFPGAERLRRCKIVSHRGQHDTPGVRENTLAAFEIARSCGVWGIELDVRWTRDLVPVVTHDPELRRVFQLPLRVAALSFSELRARAPLVPSLAEVVAACGRRQHLMIDLKQEAFLDPPRQRRRLADELAALSPGRDYHFLSLSPALFDTFGIAPSQTYLPVGQGGLGALSRLALRRRYGGLTGHYLLLSDRLIARHQQAAQATGTGFVASRNCLFRELNRGVDWIFSNHAARLQAIRNALLAGSGCPPDRRR